MLLSECDNENVGHTDMMQFAESDAPFDCDDPCSACLFDLINLPELHCPDCLVYSGETNTDYRPCTVDDLLSYIESTTS